MFNQKAFLLFVLCTALLGGFGSFFVYNAIFDVPVLAIIIGVVVAIFIACMEVLFVANMFDEMRYRLQRDIIIQSLKKRHSRGQWYNHIYWWITQKIRGK